MSNPSRSFRTYCLTKTAVTDEISTRFWPNRLPKNPTFPCAIYNEISRTPEHHLSGAAALTKVRIQVDIFAEGASGREDAEDAANGFRDAADGYVGAAGSEYIQTCHLDSQRDDHDEPIDASDVPLYRISQDWIVAVTETIPSL